MFSLSTNLPKFWEFYFDEELQVLIPSVWKRFKIYNIFKAFFNFILNTFVPLYFLIYWPRGGNWLRQPGKERIKKKRKEKKKRMKTMKKEWKRNQEKQ